MTTLTDLELTRYHRQINLRGFDIDKQEKLKSSKTLIIGLGGLGCAASQYLAAAGIGELTLVDFDMVSVSNLQRQILHTDKTVGMLKVESAYLRLSELNPNVKIDTVFNKQEDQALTELIQQHDIVLDCTDNLATREQLNRLCFFSKKTLISGAVIRMEGLLTVFTYQPNQSCYRCLSQFFSSEQASCVEAGVMSPLVGVIGSMQALEAIKVLTHYGKPLIDRLLMIDAMTMQFNEIALFKQPNCPICDSNEK